MTISRRSFTRIVPGAVLSAVALQRLEAQQGGGMFQHGVASGDPLYNRVILWTRVTPSSPEDTFPVEWIIAEDPSLKQVYQHGLTYTNGAFDYTVKVDVGRLAPGHTYYYAFFAKGVQSPVGRTKTLPIGTVSRARFAVVSCSNYPYGFFNAYRNIAARADLDLVLHLGDYIYEYGNGDFGDGSKIGRIPFPNREIVSLMDYRTRLAQYRTDPDLQEAHRQHPWVVVWDDHETANNGYLGGAENHQPATEGDWSVRRAVSAQAWFEWMPVRENPFLDGQIYRTFRFGDLLSINMLDTRYAGRDQQAPANSPLILSPNRTIMGAEQEAWFYQELLNSRARGIRWRFVGQQVMMGQLFNPDGTPFNPDQWDGYAANRARLLGSLAANSINNVVVLSGDIHSSWGNEIAPNPFLPTGYTPQAVEFVGPGVTSPAIEDATQAAGLAAQVLATHPHVKFVDLFHRGYMLIDLDKDHAQAEWYHIQTLTERNGGEDLARVLQTANGESRLRTGTASAPRTNSDPLAP